MSGLYLTLTSLLKDFSQPRRLIRPQRIINLFFSNILCLLGEKHFFFWEKKNQQKKVTAGFKMLMMKTPAAELFQPQGHGAHGRKTAMCCFHQMVFYCQLLWKKPSLKEAFLRLRAINKGYRAGIKFPGIRHISH